MNREDTTVRVQPGEIPKTKIVWPTFSHHTNQIQQTKGSAKPQNQVAFKALSTQPSQSAVSPRTTPAKVSRLRVTSKVIGGQKQITVKFTHPGGDPYFAGANVYLRRAGQQPTLVAGGAKSPLTFMAAPNQAPHSLFVTSTGNWGETDVLLSPSARVRL
jgi:hypothetical protein